MTLVIALSGLAKELGERMKNLNEALRKDIEKAKANFREKTKK